MSLIAPIIIDILSGQTSASGRIWPLVAQQGDIFPHIVFAISEKTVQTLNKTVTTTIGGSIVFDCYALDYDDVRGMQFSVLQYMLGDHDSGLTCYDQGSTDDFEIVPGNQMPIYKRTINLDFSYSEPPPPIPPTLDDITPFSCYAGDTLTLTWDDYIAHCVNLSTTDVYFQFENSASAFEEFTFDGQPMVGDGSDRLYQGHVITYTPNESHTPGETSNMALMTVHNNSDDAGSTSIQGKITILLHP